MNIIDKIPKNVSSKIKFYFRHPVAALLIDYWKIPVIERQCNLIAQINRYNWLTYSSDSHNYGNSIFSALWRTTIYAKNSPLNWKLKMHNVLEPNQQLSTPNNVILELGELHIIVSRKVRRKLWKCNKKGIHYANNNEWKKRSLYGGVYPISKRPKTRVPRNPWTKKWNIRWKKNGKLRKLYSKNWKREPWRICEWEGRGAIVKTNNGEQRVFMGPINIEWIPLQHTNIEHILI